jgi:hypothetical protein
MTTLGDKDIVNLAKELKNGSGIYPLRSFMIPCNDNHRRTGLASETAKLPEAKRDDRI